MAKDKKERKSYVPERLFSKKIVDVNNDKKIISRSSSFDYKNRSMAVDTFPWEQDYYNERENVSYNLNDLKGSGYKKASTHFDSNEVDVFKPAVEKKFGTNNVKVLTAEDSDGSLVYEIWVKSDADVKTNIGDTKEEVVAVAEDNKTKVANFVLDPKIEKLAWDYVQRYSILDGMVDKGFNVYQSADNSQVYKKVKEKDPKTGEAKYYLVRKKRSEDDDSKDKKDSNDKKEKTASEILFGENEVKTARVARKVLKIAAKKNEEDVDNSDDTQTPANDNAGPNAKKIKLDSGWKKAIDDYLKEVKDNKIDPLEIEIKVVDWKVIDN